MASPRWKNTYSLSPEQIVQLEEAEDKIESMEINKAEEILLSMIKTDPNCIPDPKVPAVASPDKEYARTLRRLRPNMLFCLFLKSEMLAVTAGH